MSIVGIIPDTHIPFQHPMALRFVLDTFEKHKVSKVVHIGDVVDNHQISPTHEPSPNSKSQGDEVASARKEIEKWHKNFPGIPVCIGNHDERHFRKAASKGIASVFLKGFNELWGTSSWKWEFEHLIDNVIYEHGTGCSGVDAAFLRALGQRNSVVIGHTHAGAGVKYHTNPRSRIFGLNAGCLIDPRAYAFEYSRVNIRRPVLGCGIVYEGDIAFFIPMACGPGEKYHRSRA